MENTHGEFASSDPRDPSTTNPGHEDPWVTEEEVSALAEERDVMGSDLEAQAEKILQDNLPAIVLSVVKLARSAESETVRLNAGKYVIDRNLGRVTDPDKDSSNPLEAFLGEVVSEVS